VLFFLLCFTTLRGRIMLLPFMTLVAFGFVGLLRRWLSRLWSRLKTGREVISRYSSQKIGQADKKYLRSCGSRTLMFFEFLRLRGRDWQICRMWLTLHIGKRLEAMHWFS
jgi:hypothetical protein